MFYTIKDKKLDDVLTKLTKIERSCKDRKYKVEIKKDFYKTLRGEWAIFLEVEGEIKHHETIF